MANTSELVPDEDQNAIFSGVYFAVIPSEIFPTDEVERVIKKLEENGGTNCPLGSSSQLKHITHLISPTADFPAYHDAVDAFIHVVKPTWIDHSVAKKKAANPRQYSPDPAFFLNDVVLCCADDIPEGDKDAIVGGVVAMGGQYSGTMTKLVTHVVALNMRNPTCKLITERGLKCKIVLTHWFDDCLKLGKKIDSSPYELPDPPLLRQDQSSPIRHKVPKAILGASQLTHEFQPPTSPSKRRKELSVFMGKSVLVDHDIDISEHLMQSIANVINRGGGDMTNDLQQADMLICQYRESENFALASRAGIDVGNLNWLYHLINTDTWTDPTRRLLHYPVPKTGVPGFHDFKISISNYTGEARIYLESLVHAAGGQFSKSMAQDNTHLITSHTMSEKCDAAREWNIHMVNHLWLEETYARCQIQSITNEKFTFFPRRTNLVEVVGQTPIDREAVELAYFPKPKDKSPQKLQPLEPNSSAVRTPGANSTNKIYKSRDIQTPAAPGKENETPDSRGAKARALSKLHVMAPDIALYQKEAKRKGGVIYGGRRIGDLDRIPLSAPTSTGRKRSRDDSEDIEPDPVAEIKPAKATKKQKKVKETAPEISTETALGQPVLRVLATSWSRTATSRNGAEPETEKAKLRKLGIELIDPKQGDLTDLNFDILAAPRPVKTVKFLCAVASAPDIINTEWLDEMLRTGKRLDEKQFKLLDRPDGGSFSESIQRAKENKEGGGMLHGQMVFCTPSVNGGWEAYRDIVRANGGTLALYKGRETTVSGLKKKENLLNGVGEDGGPGATQTDLFLISDESDKKHWSRFRDMAASENLKPRIVKPDWCKAIAMAQDPTLWDPSWECDL